MNKKFSIIFDWRYIASLLLVVYLIALLTTRKIKINIFDMIVFTTFVVGCLFPIVMHYGTLHQYPKINEASLLFGYLYSLLIFVLFYLIRNELPLKFLIKSYVFSVLFLVVSIVADYFKLPIHEITIYESYHDRYLSYDATDYHWRPTGWVYGPNIVAFVIIPLLTIISSVTGIRYIVPRYVSYIGLILPQSKTLLVAWFTGQIFKTYQKVNGGYKIFMLLSLIILGTIFLYNYSTDIIGFFTLSTMTFRYLIWENALISIQNNLFGQGIGASRLFSLPYQVGTIHNSYLALSGDLGILPTLIIIYDLIRRFLRNTNIYYRTSVFMFVLLSSTQEVFFFGAYSIMIVMTDYVTRTNDFHK